MSGRRWAIEVRFPAWLWAMACGLLLWGWSLPADAQTTDGCDTRNLLAGRLPVRSNGVERDARLLTDGRAPREGAEWDDASAVVLQSTSAELTYDFGEARTISAVHLLGDANDVYRISGSLSGAEGSFQLLTEAKNVRASEGHGLRSRALRLTVPASVRFLRLQAASGDNAYSLAEVAAHCQVPEPFPQPLAPSEAPAASPSPPERAPAVDSPSLLGKRLLWLAAVLAIYGALGAFSLLRARRKRKAAETQLRSSEWPERGLLLMFLLSGCAALIYEVVWVHVLRLVIGASSLSVGIVLASFMGGMFLGSLFFSRWVPQSKDALKVYALLELGIGVYGLLMPLILPLVRSLYIGLVGYGPLGIALRGLVAAIVLLPPTALMGATLPAIARRYSHEQSGMARLASLYSANTIGAVLGSLLSAFYLLAVWDVWVATFTAVSLNLLVFGLAWLLARAQGSGPAAGAREWVTEEGEKAATSTRAQLYAVFVGVAASGFTALGAQIIWTRLLTLLFGATVYAFAIILAVFLAALGMGSAVAAYLLKRGLAPARGLAWTQAALVPALLLSTVLLTRVVPYSSPSFGTPTLVLHALHVLRAADVILPAAVLWGMSFPFGLAAAGLGRADPARSSGHLYAANTLGAIFGALAVSFWLIPRFGTHVAQQVLIVVAGLSAAVLFQAQHTEGDDSSKAQRWPFAALPIMLLALAFASAGVAPGLSKVFLAHGRYAWNATPKDQYSYVSEGASSTVAVHVAPNGTRHFHVSGRVEASNNPADLRLERLLGHLSALAHPRPKSVLVVGLGAGVTAGSFTLYPEVERIVICEIEPRVAGAAAQFARENYAVLNDPRVTLIFDDARHFLATTSERFDVITSDPIHPWVRGNSILFSREYYGIVRSRLNPGGIATQWVPLYETSEQAIQIQMRTFTDAFPNGTVWNSAQSGRGYDVVLLGSGAPMRLDVPSLQSRIDGNRAVALSLREANIGSAVELLATYATDSRDMQPWLRGVPVNDDFSLKLEYISGLALNDDAQDRIYENMVAGRRYPEPLFIAPEAMAADLRRRLP